MVMQFPELENPGQISPCHSCTSLGFAMEMMSMKPAKGRRRFSDAGDGASATGLRKHGALLLEIPVTDLCQRWLSQNQKTGVRSWGGVISIGFQAGVYFIETKSKCVFPIILHWIVCKISTILPS